jgi:hypothetical protein
MALGNNSNDTYVSINDGKVVQSIKNPIEGSKQRTNKLGKLVNELHHDYIEGFLMGMETRENDYGKQWIISIVDDSASFKLTIPYSGQVAKSLLKTLPNIDLNKIVKLQPSMKIEDDIKKTSLFVSQGGSALKWAFTKDNLNGCPPMEQVLFQGKQRWDDTKQMIFLEELVKQKFANIKPPVKAEPKTEAKPSKKYEVIEDKGQASFIEGDDDLPF